MRVMARNAGRVMMCVSFGEKGFGWMLSSVFVRLIVGYWRKKTELKTRTEMSFYPLLATETKAGRGEGYIAKREP